MYLNEQKGTSLNIATVLAEEFALTHKVFVLNTSSGRVNVPRFTEAKTIRYCRVNAGVSAVGKPRMLLLPQSKACHCRLCSAKSKGPMTAGDRINCVTLT